MNNYEIINETSEKIVTVLNVFSTFTVSNINKNTTSISGKGISGAKVVAYVNGKQIGSATVSSDGTYKITIPNEIINKYITNYGVAIIYLLLLIFNNLPLFFLPHMPFACPFPNRHRAMHVWLLQRIHLIRSCHIWPLE